MIFKITLDNQNVVWDKESSSEQNVVKGTQMSQYWPQITYIVLVILGIGISLERHGKPKTGTYNVLVDLVGTAIGLFIVYSGGFFK